MKIIKGDYVSAEGYKGIAFRVVQAKGRPDSSIQCVMVGDDRVHEFSLDELTKIDRKVFCGSCGQIGCTHDNLDRSN